jgi:ppGpp synthetase/RelA/SpoT-type nucleotidyltranferase
MEERLQSALSGLDRSVVYNITHRIKTVNSIKEKMERKPDRYRKASDLRDILGFRVICFFEEGIDLVAEKISGAFRVDRDKSKDKRNLIDATSFGYLSLHYIIALPDSDEFPEDLRSLWVEVQIRTVLQHVWAEIEHDLGYKSVFGTPREVRRNFSKAASLLETADDLFSGIHKSLTNYKQEVVRSIENDEADNLYLDAITITEFTARSKTYQKLLSEIAAITGATVNAANAESQLAQLDFLGIHTLGELLNMIEKEHDTALRLAKEKLSGTDLEELSSTVAFYYLYRAVLINCGCSPERIKEFLSLTYKDQKSIDRNVRWILDARSSDKS